MKIKKILFTLIYKFLIVNSFAKLCIITPLKKNQYNVLCYVEKSKDIIINAHFIDAINRQEDGKENLEFLYIIDNLSFEENPPEFDFKFTCTRKSLNDFIENKMISKKVINRDRFIQLNYGTKKIFTIKKTSERYYKTEKDKSTLIKIGENETSDFFIFSIQSKNPKGEIKKMIPNFFTNQQIDDQIKKAEIIRMRSLNKEELKIQKSFTEAIEKDNQRKQQAEQLQRQKDEEALKHEE